MKMTKRKIFSIVMASIALLARQLFAKNGLESTTMNDIATASGKGRRTLYTYYIYS